MSYAGDIANRREDDPAVGVRPQTGPPTQPPVHGFAPRCGGGVVAWSRRARRLWAPRSWRRCSVCRRGGGGAVAATEAWAHRRARARRVGRWFLSRPPLPSLGCSSAAARGPGPVQLDVVTPTLRILRPLPLLLNHRPAPPPSRRSLPVKGVQAVLCLRIPPPPPPVTALKVHVTTPPTVPRPLPPSWRHPSQRCPPCQPTATTESAKRPVLMPTPSSRRPCPFGHHGMGAAAAARHPPRRRGRCRHPHLPPLLPASPPPPPPPSRFLLRGCCGRWRATPPSTPSPSASVARRVPLAGAPLPRRPAAAVRAAW